MKYSFLYYMMPVALLAFSVESAQLPLRKGPSEMPSSSQTELPVSKNCRENLQAAQSLLAQIVSPKQSRDEEGTLIPYNQMMIHLSNASSEAGLFSNVHPDKAMREAAEKCEQDISEFSTNLSLNRDLYEALLAVDPNTLDATAQRMLHMELIDFKRAGVALDEASREKIKKLSEELTVVSQDFGRNILEDVRAIELDSVTDLAGLPDDYIKSHQPGPDGKIRISTDYPDYISFMQYAQNSEHRKALWTTNLQRAFPKNVDVLNKMLTKRDELAKILGYASFAQYKVEPMMIKTPQKVASFIDSIVASTKAAAEAELAELLTEKKLDDPKATQVFGYEYAYLTEKITKKKLAFDSASMRPYFEYSRVKEGLLALVSEMYDLEFKKAKQANTWHPSVEAFDVLEKGQKIGRIYLDMHPREGKFKHAAQFSVKSGILGQQLPEGALVCNFPEPQPNEPAFMDYDEVVTFFHEFGHLMHHTLAGKQKWSRFSGVATEWDFVEAPSQFFEEWAADKQVLQRFAKNYFSGEVISGEQVKKLKAANEYGKALHARQQMFYAALSYQYYNRDPKSFDPLKLQIELQNSYSPFPYVPNTHFNVSFGHLDDYSAMYYTYMWSLVIAKDLFTPFQKDGLMNKEHALAFKKYVLTPGGSKDANDLVHDFLGRDYNFTAFSNWLAQK